MISKEDELKIIEKYQKGLSSPKIGKLFGISSVSVINVLKRNNINTRIQSDAQPRIMGNKSHRWKGGCWLYVRKQTLVRDDYTCQICGHREPEIMSVDHIKPKSMYPELKFELNNLITLCPNCHARKTNREKKIHNYKINGE